MTLDTLVDQTLQHATATLSLARNIRSSVSRYLWRPNHRFTALTT